MHVVFVSHLARPAAAEAGVIGEKLGMTEYEARLALSAPVPAVLATTGDRDRAAEMVVTLRARGHGAHAFDEAGFVPSEQMTRMDDFRLDPDGVRRVQDGALLPYGDVFAILHAMHATTGARVRANAQLVIKVSRGPRVEGGDVVTKVYEREQVAYFFRRSGERPWILRERHASYAGLGPDRESIANANFMRTLHRVREACPTAIFDDRLLRRQVAERLVADTHLRTSSEGVDLLAHLVAMAIVSQGGSPYR